MRSRTGRRNISWQFLSDAFEERGEIEIVVGDSAGVVRGQSDCDTIVDVRPFGMVIHFLDGGRGGRHEAKGFGESGEFVLAMELAVFDGPAGELSEGGGDFRFG